MQLCWCSRKWQHPSEENINIFIWDPFSAAVFLLSLIGNQDVFLIIETENKILQYFFREGRKKPCHNENEKREKGRKKIHVAFPFWLKNYWIWLVIIITKLLNYYLCVYFFQGCATYFWQNLFNPSLVSWINWFVFFARFKLIIMLQTCL